MSLKEVMDKLEQLEQQIQLILKDNVALYLQNEELKKRIDVTEQMAKQAAKDAAPMRIIGGPTLKAPMSFNPPYPARFKAMIEKGKQTNHKEQTKQEK
jgi:regulator of replication initiation timing